MTLGLFGAHVLGFGPLVLGFGARAFSQLGLPGRGFDIFEIIVVGEINYRNDRSHREDGVKTDRDDTAGDDRGGRRARKKGEGDPQTRLAPCPPDGAIVLARHTYCHKTVLAKNCASAMTQIATVAE